MGGRAPVRSRRGKLVGLALAGALAGSLAGCGKSASPAAKASAAATKVGSPKPAPADCKSAASVGAHDAAFAVGLVLSVDYRNARQLPAVVEPLLTSAFFANFSSSLTAGLKTLVVNKVTNAAAVDTVAYAAGACAAPTYTVAVVRETSDAKDGSRSSNITLRAAMSWNGATYLLANLAS